MRSVDKKTAIAAVVLAAGSSVRMGDSNKLMACVKGKPMIHWVVEAAIGSRAQSLTVVTGFEAGKIKNSLSGFDISYAHNKDFATGMASSLRVGIESIGEVGGALILLADMPFLTAEHLDLLITQFNHEPDESIIVPVYAGYRGNPVLWPRRYFPDMINIKGDTGARGLLNIYASRVREQEINSAAVLVDIDTAEVLSDVNAQG